MQLEENSSHFKSVGFNLFEGIDFKMLERSQFEIQNQRRTPLKSDKKPRKDHRKLVAARPDSHGEASVDVCDNTGSHAQPKQQEPEQLFVKSSAQDYMI